MMCILSAYFFFLSCDFASLVLKETSGNSLKSKNLRISNITFCVRKVVFLLNATELCFPDGRNVRFAFAPHALALEGASTHFWIVFVFI